MSIVSNRCKTCRSTAGRLRDTILITVCCSAIRARNGSISSTLVLGISYKADSKRSSGGCSESGFGYSPESRRRAISWSWPATSRSTQLGEWNLIHIPFVRSACNWPWSS